MLEERKIGVVIVAGGSGSRMGSAVPKQFLKVGGDYVLARTLKAFLPVAHDIVVVLPTDQQERWREICGECGLEGTHRTAVGGATRFHSVRAGVSALGECALVAIHDGVRPLVSRAMIARGVACAARCGSAVPVVAAVDSFRIVEEGELKVVDRSLLRAIQTPQIFDAELLRRAYECEPEERFTDDATVVEGLGVKLAFYKGERRNIKITTPEDLVVAEAYLRAETL